MDSVLSPASFASHGHGKQKECGAMLTVRSEEHTSELQSQSNLVCRLLLEKKKRILLWCDPLGINTQLKSEILFLVRCVIANQTLRIYDTSAALDAVTTAMVGLASLDCGVS